MSDKEVSKVGEITNAVVAGDKDVTVQDSGIINGDKPVDQKAGQSGVAVDAQKPNSGKQQTEQSVTSPAIEKKASASESGNKKVNQRTLEEVRAEEEGNDSAEEAFPETLVDNGNARHPRYQNEDTLNANNTQHNQHPRHTEAVNGNGSHGGEDNLKESAINQYYNSRKERQQVELNNQQLANRISLLKQEEVRTLKKIEETRKKAMEIYYLKLKNQKKSVVKNAAAENDLVRKRDKVSQLRTSSMESRKTNKETFETMKLANVRSIKESKAANEKKIDLKRQTQVTMYREKNESVRLQREQRLQKIQDFQREKQEAIKREILLKTQKEDKTKVHKQNELKRMELLEMDIIQRLQSTQIMQKHAYEELESALLLNTNDFYSKYLEKEEEPTETGGEQQSQQPGKTAVTNENQRFADDRSQKSVRSESQPHSQTNKNEQENDQKSEEKSNKQHIQNDNGIGKQTPSANEEKEEKLHNQPQQEQQQQQPSQPALQEQKSS